jgi:hypothetical protein
MVPVPAPVFDSPYLFRGHGNELWTLQPSLTRVLNEAKLAVKTALRIELIALDQFQRQSHLHIVGDESIREGAPNGLTAWWSLMQHHYAPTRLLDWTASPFVAAYFAVVSHPRQPGVVWTFHLSTVREYMQMKHGHWELASNLGDALKPEAPTTLYAVRRPRETDRMVAQQSLFTVSAQLLADHGVLISQMMGSATEPPKFFGMRIRPELKAAFLRRLVGIKVTAKALFPGADGLGRSLAELVDLEVHHQKGTSGAENG